MMPPKKWLFVAGLLVFIGIVILAGMSLPHEHSVSNLYIIPAGTFGTVQAAGTTAAATTVAYPSDTVIYSVGPEILRPEDAGLNSPNELYSRLQKIVDDSDPELDRYRSPNGPVTGFGYDLLGTMVVRIDKEQGVNQSTMDAIYRIIGRNGEKNGIRDVPCKFLSTGIATLDAGRNPGPDAGPVREEPGTRYPAGRLVNLPPVPRFYRDTLPAGVGSQWIDLAWTNRNNPRTVIVYTPDAVLGPFENTANGRVDQRIFLEISSGSALTPGPWYYEVRSERTPHNTSTFLIYRNGGVTP